MVKGLGLLDSMDGGGTEETFEQQMKELNVPVEKKSAKALTGWINARSCAASTVKDIRIGKTIMSFSPKLVKHFEVEPGKYKFAFRVVEYDQNRALLLKPDKKGITLKNYTGAAYTTAVTKAMGQAFKEYGVKQGSYTVNVVKDGYLAVLEGE